MRRADSLAAIDRVEPTGGGPLGEVARVGERYQVPSPRWGSKETSPRLIAHQFGGQITAATTAATTEGIAHEPEQAAPRTTVAEGRNDRTHKARAAASKTGSPTRRRAAGSRNAMANTQTSRRGGSDLLLLLDPSTQRLADSFGPPAITSSSIEIARAATGRAQAGKATSMTSEEGVPRLANDGTGIAKRFSPRAPDGPESTRTKATVPAAPGEGNVAAARRSTREKKDDEPRSTSAGGIRGVAPPAPAIVSSDASAGVGIACSTV